MARNPASTRSAASARTVPTYPRNPVGGVYIPGAKSIEASTGDIAITANGWVESEKYKWYGVQTSTAWSIEFDTAVTRTGAKTLKISATDITGRAGGYQGPTVTLADLKKYNVRIKPNTAYVLSCWCKTTNAAANSARISVNQYDSAGVIGTASQTNMLTGTNDWTLLTYSFTSDADAEFILIYPRLAAAGNISDAWFDVNSMTLTETLPRNPVV